MDRTSKANVTPVRQRSQYSCMASSLAMCLRALEHEVTEDEVNAVMGARPMKGASWEQALATAQHYGCRATLTMPSTVEQLKTWTDTGIPIMIAWNPEGRPWSHASVVFDVDADLNVYVADPNIPNPKETVRVVPESEFYGKWYEKFPDYLVRRPACAIEREITVGGQQIAPRTASSNVPPNATKVRGTRFWISEAHSRGPFRDGKLYFKIFNEYGGVVGGHLNREDAIEMAKEMASQRMKVRASSTTPKRRGQLQPRENQDMHMASDWTMDRPFSGTVTDAFITRIKAHPDLRHMLSIQGKNITLVMADYFDDPKYDGGSEYDVQMFRMPGGVWRLTVGMTHGALILKKLSALLKVKPIRLARWGGGGRNERITPVDTVLRAASIDSRYKGNPDGQPIYDVAVDRGVDQALSGGFDIMKRLQDRYLVEQGHSSQNNGNPQLNNETLGQTGKAANRWKNDGGDDGYERARERRHGLLPNRIREEDFSAEKERADRKQKALTFGYLMDLITNVLEGYVVLNSDDHAAHVLVHKWMSRQRPTLSAFRSSFRSLTGVKNEFKTVVSGLQELADETEKKGASYLREEEWYRYNAPSWSLKYRRAKNTMGYDSIPLPSIQAPQKTVVDSATDEKIKILDALLAAWPGGQSFVDDIKKIYLKGGNPTIDQLKTLRNMLYRNRLRNEADHFRQASSTAPKTQEERRREQSQLRGKAPKPRNDVARAVAERGNRGQGGHKNKGDYERGRARQPKHRGQDRAAAISRLVERWATQSDVYSLDESYVNSVLANQGDKQ